jgi:hypothetical protein
LLASYKLYWRWPGTLSGVTGCLRGGRGAACGGIPTLAPAANAPQQHRSPIAAPALIPCRACRLRPALMSQSARGAGSFDPSFDAWREVKPAELSFSPRPHASRRVHKSCCRTRARPRGQLHDARHRQPAAVLGGDLSRPTATHGAGRRRRGHHHSRSGRVGWQQQPHRVLRLENHAKRAGNPTRATSREGCGLVPGPRSEVATRKRATSLARDTTRNTDQTHVALQLLGLGKHILKL